MIMFELDCVEIYKKDGFKDAIINAVLKGKLLIKQKIIGERNASLHNPLQQKARKRNPF